MFAPSARQLEALRLIADHVRRRGYPPVTSELGLALGVSSTNAVSWHLAKLERGGLITRERRGNNIPRSRTLRITTDGLLALATARSPEALIIPERRCAVCDCSTFLSECHGRSTEIREARAA